MILGLSTAEILEWISVILNIFFTILLGREIRVGWLLGFVASAIGVWLYGEQSAWLMSALNGFYAAMGIYGWWNWGRTEVVGDITTMSASMHAGMIAMGGLITFGLVLLMRAIGLEGEYLWLEAFIAAFAIIATWLMSKKVLENWYYWTIGDAVGVYYNYKMEFNGYTVLMLVYIVLAIVGFINWRKQMTLQLATSEK